MFSSTLNIRERYGTEQSKSTERRFSRSRPIGRNILARGMRSADCRAMVHAHESNNSNNDLRLLQVKFK